MKYVKNFNELTKYDADIAGGKGASLGEMLNHNIPVPDGYVVTADTFDHFIQETDLKQEIQAHLDKVDTKAIHTVERASEKIQELIKEANMPQDIADEVLIQYHDHKMDHVAVRSSATAEDGADHAWAGQLSSYLNVNKDTLLKHVQECWASLFTPRAIFYRYEKGLHTTHISVAVVVQKMINSEKSGIAFSVHPVTEDYNQIIIEAGLGLGEAIVSGSVTPDSYVTTKDPHEIIDVNINTQTKALYRSDTYDAEHGFNEWKDLPQEQVNEQVLSQEQILELSKIIVTIENHYGFPCDIEWAFEDETFYIVQSRPITTLKPLSGQVKKRVFDKHYVRDNSLLSFGIWHKNQTKLFEEIFGWNMTSFVLDATDGVTTVFYETSMFDVLEKKVAERISDAKNFEPLVKDYNSYMDYLEPIWHDKKGIEDRDDFLKFVDYSVKGWSGMSIGYFAPNIEELPQKYKDVGVEMRLRGAEYFEDTDRIVKLSLKELYPELGELSRYLLLEEVENNTIPKISELEKRKEHFVFFEDKLLTEVDSGSWAQEHELVLNVEKPKEVGDSIKGTTAMKGKVTGKVKVIMKRSLIETVEDGDILVTSMTTPDFMPAMNKAAAFVTDEGGVTCHASIVARELDKPCVIGTKFATEILKDGDLVEVDADNGIIKILEKKAEKNLIDEYLSKIGNQELYSFEASLCPLYVSIPWYGYNVRGLQKTQFPLLVINSREKTYAVLPEDEYKKPGRDVFESYVAGDISIQELKNTYEPIYEKFDKLYNDYVNVDFATLSEKEILDLFEVNYRESSDLIGNTLFIETLSYDFALDVLQDKDLVNNIWEKSTYPYFESFESRQRGIIHDLYNKGFRSEKLVNHAMFIFTDYYRPKNKSVVESEIKNILEKEYVFSDKKKELERWKKTLNKKEQKIVDYIQYVMEARDLRKDPLAKAQYVLYTLAVEFCSRVGIDEKYANHIALADYLKGSRWLQENKEFIIERYDGQISLLDVDHSFESQAIDYDLAIKELMEKSSHLDSEHTEIYGQSACKGKVEAEVQIVLEVNDSVNFKEGNILVTSMTRPEFVPLMKKASAIITNEGGITCHAAIVSRELNIPCIIGTKFATQVLKDGDLVEVDADNGIVHILNEDEEGGKDKKPKDVPDNNLDIIKKFKQGLDGHEIITQRGDISIAFLGDICNVIQDNIVKNYGYTNIQPILNLQKGSKGIIYFDLEMYRDFSRVSYKKIKTSVYDLPEYKDYRKIAKEISRRYASFNIADKFEDLVNQAEENFLLGKKLLAPTLFAEAVDHHLVQEFAEKLNVDNLDKFVEISTLPAFPSFVIWLDKMLLKGEDIQWSFTNYFGSPEKNERSKKANNLILEKGGEKAIKEEIKLLESSLEKNKGIIKDFSKKLNPKEKILLEFIQESMHIRDERKEYILKLFTMQSDVLRKIGELYDLSYKEMSVLSIRELSKIKDSSFRDELKKRSQKGAVMINWTDSCEMFICDFDDANEIFKSKSNNEKVLSGVTANKGIATGPVSVILTQDDFSLFNDGDILVTGMTRSEYVPLMKKASAILTDEGGVTCHAAIISRELGKPCIIAMRDVTQKLKDGDIVEVDADNGVIKLIKG